MEAQLITLVGIALRAAARRIDDAFGWLILWWPLVPVFIVCGASFVAVIGENPPSFTVRFAAGMLTAAFYFSLLFAEAS